MTSLHEMLMGLLKRPQADTRHDPAFDGRLHPARLEESEQGICDAIRNVLLEQRKTRPKNSLYWETQIAFAYNSNRIEGSCLTMEDARAIFETGATRNAARDIDDIREMNNHFELFDYMLDTLDETLTPELILKMHGVLKFGISRTPKGAELTPSEWKTLPTAVGGIMSVEPALVPMAIENLLSSYEAHETTCYGDIADFHVKLERIHPFLDGNGRIGRMIMFRECLSNGLIPFIVLDQHKSIYYEGLEHYSKAPEMINGFICDMAEGYYREFSGLIPWGPRG